MATKSSKHSKPSNSNTFSIFQDEREKCEELDANVHLESSTACVKLEEIKKMSFFCEQTGININEEDIKFIYEIHENKSLHERICELSASIAETPLEKAQKRKQDENFKKQQEQKKREITQNLSDLEIQLKKLREELEKLEKEKIEKTKSLQTLEKSQSAHVPFKIEVQAVLKEFVQKGMPASFETSASSEVTDFLKNFSINCKKPSKKGTKIDVQFAEVPKPVLEEPSSNSEKWILTKPAEPVSLNEGEGNVLSIIENTLRKGRVSFIRGNQTDKTNSNFVCELYGSFILKKNGHYETMTQSEFQRKQSKCGLTILHCVAIAYSNDLIEEFVTKLQKESLDSSVIEIIEKNIVPKSN
jgi:ribosomal protein L12E/L44/L45/RPP1/RPP2